MDFENSNDPKELERIKVVEKFMMNEIGTIYQNLHYYGYEEVTFSDVLKAYEIMLLNSNGKEK